MAGDLLLSKYIAATALLIISLPLTAGCSDQPRSTTRAASNSRTNSPPSTVAAASNSESGTKPDVVAQDEAEQKGEDFGNLRVFTAVALVNAYTHNEVAADEIFKQRRFIVSGKVDRIGKDILSNSYVTFEGRGFRNTQCVFPDDAIPLLAKLRPGQNVSIVGTCDGLMMNVLLSDCVLIDYVDPYTEGTTLKEIQQPQKATTSPFAAKYQEYTQRAEAEEQKEKVETDKVKAEADRVKLAAKAAAAKAAEDAKYRTWTSADGKYTTEAKALSYAKEIVTIETREGKKTKGSLDRLSDADNDFVIKWRKQH